MAITVVKDRITRSALQALAQDDFVDMIKVVADINSGMLACGGESHRDGVAVLLVEGSLVKDLWGLCLHFDKPLPEAFEFRSQINVRPKDGSVSVQINDQKLCQALTALVRQHLDWDK